MYSGNLPPPPRLPTLPPSFGASNVDGTHDNYNYSNVNHSGNVGSGNGPSYSSVQHRTATNAIDGQSHHHLPHHYHHGVSPASLLSSSTANNKNSLNQKGNGAASAASHSSSSSSSSSSSPAKVNATMVVAVIVYIVVTLYVSASNFYLPSSTPRAQREGQIQNDDGNHRTNHHHLNDEDDDHHSIHAGPATTPYLGVWFVCAVTQAILTMIAVYLYTVSSDMSLYSLPQRRLQCLSIWRWIRVEGVLSAYNALLLVCGIGLAWFGLGVGGSRHSLIAPTFHTTIDEDGHLVYASTPTPPSAVVTFLASFTLLCVIVVYACYAAADASVYFKSKLFSSIFPSIPPPSSSLTDETTAVKPQQTANFKNLFKHFAVRSYAMFANSFLAPIEKDGSRQLNPMESFRGAKAMGEVALVKLVFHGFMLVLMLGFVGPLTN